MTAKTTTLCRNSATPIDTRSAVFPSPRLSLGVWLARTCGAFVMTFCMTLLMATTAMAVTPTSPGNAASNSSADNDIHLNDNSDGKLDGQEAPDFALRSIDNTNLRLSEFRGQVVLINFWASWCGACRQAMPAFNDLHEKYARAGLVMLSVNVDDEAHRGIHMAQSLKIRYPVLLDERKEVSRLFQVGTMPLTVLIDRGGIVRFIYVGFNAGDQSKFIPPLRKLLNE